MNADFLTKPQERLHVYRLPDVLNDGYCFGRGNPVAFLNVDFFDVPWDIAQGDIKSFVRKKRYFDPAARFLILGRYPTLTFTIEPEELIRGEQT